MSGRTPPPPPGPPQPTPTGHNEEPPTWAPAPEQLFWPLWTGAQNPPCHFPLHPGRSFRGQIFFFLLRTALKDRPKGPPTANRQLPSTANRHQPSTTNRHQPPPTASGDQPPTANHCQPPPTTNHQPPTAANHHQPPPTASCQPPTANRQPPPTMVEHMECPRAFLGKLVPEHFFFPVKDRPAYIPPSVVHGKRGISPPDLCRFTMRTRKPGNQKCVPKPERKIRFTPLCTPLPTPHVRN